MVGTASSLLFYILMEDTGWERIEIIIRESGMTINSFARIIGLNSGENLYRIKRGCNRVSRRIAEKIHAYSPKYSVSWIMCGGNMPDVDGAMKKVPVYREKFESRGRKFPIDYVIVPETMFYDVDYATFSPEETSYSIHFHRFKYPRRIKK